MVISYGQTLQEAPIFTTEDSWGHRPLTVSHIYLVFADSTAIVEKKDGVENVNPRQPQKD